MTRRRSTFALRCWQVAGLTLLVAVLVAAIGMTADYLARVGLR